MFAWKKKKGSDAKAESPSENYYSLNELDKKLRKRISKRSGFYVEIGANDGVNQSNTLHFEKALGWKGVLIEPIPHRFLECKKNRSKENTFFCNACVSDDYKNEFVKIIYSNLMSVAPELDLDLERPYEHAATGHQFLDEHEVTFTFGAIAKTLTSILVEANAPRFIDLFSLDVEGAELEVLKGVDFDHYTFGHLLVESRNINRLERFLNQKGYRLVEPLSVHDYLFVPATVSAG